MLNKIYNEDCMIGIKKIPDNFIDLVIIDPPYQINNHNVKYDSDLARSINSYNDELYKSNLTGEYDYNMQNYLWRKRVKLVANTGYCRGAYRYR